MKLSREDLRQLLVDGVGYFDANYQGEPYEDSVDDFLEEIEDRIMELEIDEMDDEDL